MHELLSTPFRKYGLVFWSNPSLTVGAPIRAATVRERSYDTSLQFRIRVLRQPVALLCIAGVLFVCWTPWVADL
jgi:hypothetical protein